MAKDNLVSLAQMVDEVVLWRALEHRNAGLFADVGTHYSIGFGIIKNFF